MRQPFSLRTTTFRSEEGYRCSRLSEGVGGQRNILVQIAITGPSKCQLRETELN